MAAQPPAVLALDVGGTQIRTAAVLADGTRLGRQAAGMPLDRAAAVAACAKLLRATIAALPTEAASGLGGIGISSAGPVDPWGGVIIDPPNMPALQDTPIALELEAVFGLPVYLERDTNVAALAERWIGAARGCDFFLYVTVSTGLGGSIVREGRLLLGPDGTAGELGHGTLLLDEAVPCGCGGFSHLEALASGSGLARQAAAAAVQGRSAFLANRAAAHRLSGRDVAEGEDAGDDVSRRLMEQARRAFGLTCVGWVNTFNPELIVVGGTIADRQGERWLGPARELVVQQSFRQPASRVRIVLAELADDVGLAGAWPLVAGRLADPVWRAGRPPVAAAEATPS